MIKRILATLFCVLMVSTVLVGCEEDSAQFWLDKYQEMGKGQPEVIETVDIDFYIIKGEQMSSDSNITKTVQDKINQLLFNEYHTNINIHYMTADEYANKIDAIASAEDNPETTENEAMSGIVLIDSVETMEKLSGKLANIYPYIHGDQYKSKGYGKLNKQITTSLMDAAIVVENGVNKMYCVPNNHIIGSYEYIVINKDIVSNGVYGLALPYEDDELAAITSLESAAIICEKALEKFGESSIITSVDYADYNPNSGAVITRVVNAPYEAKALMTKDNIVVNVAKYPEVDERELYSTAFAILEAAPNIYDGNNKFVRNVDSALYSERAIQVIYAINSNVEVRNLLQYGVENVNYFRDADGKVLPDSQKRYDMNIIYTGDVFKAYYSDKWTAREAELGLLQNKDTEK